ncbi:hypothetical protein [Methanopyrus sp.]
MTSIDPEEDAWLEWEETMARKGLEYVPVVVISRVRGMALMLEIFAPVSAPADSPATVFVKPYLLTLRGGGPLWEGTLEFRLNGTESYKLSRVDLSESEAWTDDWVRFEFRTPEDPGKYRLVVRYEGPYGTVEEGFQLRVVEGESHARSRTGTGGPSDARPRPRHRQHTRRRRNPRRRRGRGSHQGAA